MGNVSGDYGMDVTEWNTKSLQDSVFPWNGHKVSFGYNSEEIIDFHEKMRSVHESDTSQSVSVGVGGETNSDGDSSVSGSVEYNFESKSDDGTSVSATVEAEGKIDRDGTTSAKVEGEVTLRF